MSQSPEVLPVGSRIGKYEVVRLLGAGGMGAVYEAMHPELRKRVAVKTLLPALTANEEARERFIREGQAAARLRHPHVVDIADVGTHEGTPFLVMEYLEGEALDALYRRASPVAPATLLDLVLPVIAAIGTGHEEGVIHRDIKPQNIFLSRGRYGDVVPKVLDFGISKLAASGSMSLTSTSVFLGTVTYMSPEQAQGAKRVDGRSDEYALGLLLYEGLTGVAAYDGDNPLQVLQKVAQNQFTRPRLVNAAIPPALESALLRALARDPNHRFPTVFGFGWALLPFASERTRYLWQDVFRRGQADAEAPANFATEDKVNTGSTVVVPAARSASAFGASPADEGSGAERVSTTFNSAVLEREILAPPLGRGRWLVAGAGLLMSGLAVAGVLLFAGARKKDATPAASDIAAAVPQIETPVAAPAIPPPAAAVPVSAPVPEPVASPSAAEPTKPPARPRPVSETKPRPPRRSTTPVRTSVKAPIAPPTEPPAPVNKTGTNLSPILR